MQIINDESNKKVRTRKRIHGNSCKDYYSLIWFSFSPSFSLSLLYIFFFALSDYLRSVFSGMLPWSLWSYGADSTGWHARVWSQRQDQTEEAQSCLLKTKSCENTALIVTKLTLAAILTKWVQFDKGWNSWV